MRPVFLSRSQRIASIAELVISACKGLIITAGYESKQIWNLEVFLCNAPPTSNYNFLESKEMMECNSLDRAFVSQKVF
jgi:hypothetical protein